MNTRAVVFIGSSTEGYPVAEAIQASLSGEVEAVIWKTLFEPGYFTLETLEQKSAEFDFAVFVLSSDDVLEARGSRLSAPRDNLLLEFGLFVGRLGRDRVFFAFQSGDRPKLPSDLAGVTEIQYEAPGAFGLQPAVAKLSQQLRKRFKELGPRSRLPPMPEMGLDFSYLPEVQPAERGWIAGHNNPQGPLPVVEVHQDPRFGRCLAMDAPDGAYLDYNLPYPVQAREMHYVCRGDRWVFYAVINIWKSKDNRLERVYLRIAGWENRIAKFNDNEWSVIYRSCALERGWLGIEMSIPNLVEASFGKEGGKYRDLVGVRLRGHVTLASLAIYA